MLSEERIAELWEMGYVAKLTQRAFAFARAIEAECAKVQAEKQEPYKRGMTLQECADAEYKQEPVAWMVDTSYDRLIFQNAEQAEHFASKWDIAVVPLYTHPQPDLTAEVERLKGMVSEIQAARFVMNQHDQHVKRIAALEEAAHYYNRRWQVQEAIAKLDAVFGNAGNEPTPD